MVKAQWLESSVPAAPPNLQWLESSATGTLPSAKRLQWLESSATGTIATLVAPIANRSIGPGESLTLTAALQFGATADSWTWRRISGPVVTLSGTGASRTIVGPSLMPVAAATPLVIGIIGTVAGVDSPEVSVTITVLPQLEWYYDTPSATFKGARVVPA